MKELKKSLVDNLMGIYQDVLSGKIPILRHTESGGGKQVVWEPYDDVMVPSMRSYNYSHNHCTFEGLENYDIRLSGNFPTSIYVEGVNRSDIELTIGIINTFKLWRMIAVASKRLRKLMYEQEKKEEFLKFTQPRKKED
jgi:hypothetical protein